MTESTATTTTHHPRRRTRHGAHRRARPTWVLPAGPADGDDWTSRPKRPGRWAQALVLGAAAVGFAVAVPTAALLRDGSGPINAPVAPQVDRRRTARTGPRPDLYRGLVDIDTRLAYEAAGRRGPAWSSPPTGGSDQRHVIDGAASIVVTVVATGVSYDATVLGSDETRDVALLNSTMRRGWRR